MALQDLPAQAIRTIRPLSKFFLEAAQKRIALSDEVPDDVRERFRVIREHLPSCEYDEKRLRMPYEFAVNTFELALRFRYEELKENGTLGESYKEDPDSLQSFVDRLHKYEHLESSYEVLSDFVDVRNDSFHPDRFRYFGYAELEAIIRLIEEINQLYESPLLRTKRQKARRILASRLDEVTDEGGVLKLDGTRVLVYSATLLQYENQRDPARYWLLFYPVPRNVGQDQFQIPAPILAEVADWSNKDDGALSFETIDGVQFQLRWRLRSEESNLWDAYQEGGATGQSIHQLFMDEEWTRRTLLDLRSPVDLLQTRNPVEGTVRIGSIRSEDSLYEEWIG